MPYVSDPLGPTSFQFKELFSPRQFTKIQARFARRYGTPGVHIYMYNDECMQKKTSSGTKTCNLKL